MASPPSESQEKEEPYVADPKNPLIRLRISLKVQARVMIYLAGISIQFRRGGIA